MEDKINYKLLNILIIIAIVCLLYFIRGLWIGVVVNIFNILAPFMLAFALAYVIYPLLRKLVNSGAPKWLAILTICILGFGSLFLLMVLTIPLLYEQILLFISNITMLLSDLSTKYELNFGGLQSSLSEFSSHIISGLGSSISDGAINVVNSSVSVVSTGVVVVCAAIYFLIDMDKIRVIIKKYFNRKNRRTSLFLTKLDDELTKYIGGLGKNILIQVIEYTLAFAIIGHPNYLILGILSGLSAIIPWFGGFLVGVVLFGLSPWMTICYSDSLGILFPVLTYYLYTKPARNSWMKRAEQMLAVVVCCIGYYIKPQCMIMLIAIVLIELFTFYKERRIRLLVKPLALLVVACLSLAVTSSILTIQYESIGVKLDPEMPRR